MVTMNFHPSEIRTLIRIVTKRTGHPIRDEDLEQQAALKVIEAFTRLQHVDHPRALLLKIVEDTVRDYWRTRRTTEDLSTIDERFVAERPAYENDLDLQRRLEVLNRALDRLPQGARALLDLFYKDGQPVREIARLRSKSVSAVKMELLRARQSLARIVRSMGDKKSR